VVDPLHPTHLTLLMTSPLFEGISLEALQAMIDCLHPKVLLYKKNSYLAVEGEPFTGLGILLTGEGAVIKENITGNRNVMAMLGAGDLFGEMIAFSKKQVWPASVCAQSDCSALFIPPEKITGHCAHVCAGHAQFIKNMLSILSEKALLLNRKVQYLTINSMRGRISTYLVEQWTITKQNTLTLPLSRNDLADFLNVSRTGLSREMGRMRDEGVIEFYRSSIKINDLERLKKLAR